MWVPGARPLLHVPSRLMADAPSSGDDEDGEDEAEDTGETRFRAYGASRGWGPAAHLTNPTLPRYGASCSAGR